MARSYPRQCNKNSCSTFAMHFNGYAFAPRPSWTKSLAMRGTLCRITRYRWVIVRWARSYAISAVSTCANRADSESMCQIPHDPVPGELTLSVEVVSLTRKKRCFSVCLYHGGREFFERANVYTIISCACPERANLIYLVASSEISWE